MRGSGVQIPPAAPDFHLSDPDRWVDADPAAGGDEDVAVVEGIFEIRQALIGRLGSLNPGLARNSPDDRASNQAIQCLNAPDR